MSAARTQTPIVDDAEVSDSEVNKRKISNVQSRISALEWPRISACLHESGWARTGEVLTMQECDELRALYSNDNLFRSRVVMARHRFGLGEYKYFAYPLPDFVTELRERLYARLAAVANDWESKLGGKSHYPNTHQEFIKLCHAGGQIRPTPLMLRYESGGYNCLHQDLYGAVYFPLQTVFMLDRPELDFCGGEFVLVEQRPRAQSAAHVVSPRQGEAVIFTTRWRPVQGSRGYYRVNIRHGASAVMRGVRHTLGIVYHDAE
ncbi:MAG TPA: 2OG-Fe(II) oxygenase [Alphaproteobacteria bacterium]|nr:2OG-Fe(II) oxygenase [Alphaproteobacteria bacterium]